MVTEIVRSLNMSSKIKYRQFCEREKGIPIFSQAWYLDAVCQADQGQWDVVLVEQAGRVVASLPYVVKQRGPFRISAMPHLTKFLGPYLHPDFRSVKQAHKIIKALIEQLPVFSFFSQNCYYELQDWLPFFWKGFRQTTQYSYLLDDLSDLQSVYNNFSADYRNNKIKKAESLVKVRMDLSPEDYYQVEKMSFERQGLKFPFSLEYFKAYDAALEAQHARRMFFAVDQQGQIHSVLYLLIDSDRTYYHMAGDNPSLRSSGAGILLVWKAIQFTKEVLGLNIFDFEGSTIKSIERVRRQFGASQLPYFNIYKYNSKIYELWKVLTS